MVVGLKDEKKRIYVAIISSMAFLIFITTVGLGNPRYRSEMEPLLIILGAIGIDRLYKKLSQKSFKYTLLIHISQKFLPP